MTLNVGLFIIVHRKHALLLLSHYIHKDYRQEYLMEGKIDLY